MSNELNAVSAWLYARLTNDPDGVDAQGQPYQGLTTLIGGRIYEYVVPEGGGFPCAVFTFVSGRDLKGTGGRRIFSRGLFHVKGICEGNSFAMAGQIADRIDARLQQSEGAMGGAVIGCNRERTLQMVDADEGKRHNMLGGEYTFWITALTPADAMI